MGKKNIQTLLFNHICLEFTPVPQPGVAPSKGTGAPLQSWTGFRQISKITTGVGLFCFVRFFLRRKPTGKLPPHAHRSPGVAPLRHGVPQLPSLPPLPQHPARGYLKPPKVSGSLQARHQTYIFNDAQMFSSRRPVYDFSRARSRAATRSSLPSSHPGVEGTGNTAGSTDGC